eukprot:TRINITY_DN15152_c0_g1_i2.p1 TRINITY_DN15152_c0_g1~~TRINITY_DN15152_c0_g1_i2.p1  ORF type:complete len:402 (+),score=92.19 TRINITY_DN15152_c0_g1_i2:1031-2236(+)
MSSDVVSKTRLNPNSEFIPNATISKRIEDRKESSQVEHSRFTKGTEEFQKDTSQPNISHELQTSKVFGHEGPNFKSDPQPINQSLKPSGNNSRFNSDDTISSKSPDYLTSEDNGISHASKQKNSPVTKENSSSVKPNPARPITKPNNVRLGAFVPVHEEKITTKVPNSTERVGISSEEKTQFKQSGSLKTSKDDLHLRPQPSVPSTNRAKTPDDKAATTRTTAMVRTANQVDNSNSSSSWIKSDTKEEALVKPFGTQKFGASAVIHETHLSSTTKSEVGSKVTSPTASSAALSRPLGTINIAEDQTISTGGFKKTSGKLGEEKSSSATTSAKPVLAASPANRSGAKTPQPQDLESRKPPVPISEARTTSGPNPVRSTSPLSSDEWRPVPRRPGPAPPRQGR